MNARSILPIPFKVVLPEPLANLTAMRIFVLLMIQISMATGHGDLHEQITKISAQIISNPDDPQLWLTRADLHQSHRNPKAAHLDLQQASRIALMKLVL